MVRSAMCGKTVRLKSGRSPPVPSRSCRVPPSRGHRRGALPGRRRRCAGAARVRARVSKRRASAAVAGCLGRRRAGAARDDGEVPLLHLRHPHAGDGRGGLPARGAAPLSRHGRHDADRRGRRARPRSSASRSGALDYLAKPVLVEEVRARVEKALEKRELMLQEPVLPGRTSRRRVRELDRRNQAIVPRRRADAGPCARSEGRLHPRPLARGWPDTRSRPAVQLGFTGDRLEHIRLGGELHDIGKIGTREAVLNKPGPLTPRGVRAHQGARGARRARSSRRCLRSHPIVLAHRPLAPRAPGRRRVPRRARGRRDPARGADRGGGRRLRRDDHQPGLPALAHARRTRWTSCSGCAGSQFDPEVRRRLPPAFPDRRRLAARHV